MTIELLGMHFRARHGCLESERAFGGEFCVDVRLECDCSRAEASDCLEDTVDYSRVYAIVAEQMAVPRRLLEAVAGSIADRIRSEFPGVGEVVVRVAKGNPPVGGDCEWARVTARR